MRVLIVDDIAAVRERLAASVAAIPGVTVVIQASNGREALTAFTANPADLIVLDIQMPRPNGIEVLRALRDGEQSVPVIVLTGHRDYRRHALQLGAGYFFDKATELEAAFATIRQLAAAFSVRSE